MTKFPALTTNSSSAERTFALTTPFRQASKPRGRSALMTDYRKLLRPWQRREPETLLFAYVLIVACCHASAALPPPASPVRLAGLPSGAALLPGHDHFSGAPGDLLRRDVSFGELPPRMRCKKCRKPPAPSISAPGTATTITVRSPDWANRAGACPRSPACVVVDHALVVHQNYAT
jgi:hypothetical protein